MSLCVIFNEFQVVFLAERTDFFCVCIAAVEVNNADRLGFRCDDFFYSIVVYFKGVQLRFYKNGLKVVLCYSEYGGYIGICRNDYLIAGLHHAEFNISTEYPDEGIQSVGTADAVFCANILGEVFFETIVFLSLKVPASVNHTVYCFVNLCSMKSCYVFKT